MGIMKGIFMMVILIYTVVAVLPGVNTTVATITTPTYQVGVAGLAGLYPLFLVFAGMFAVFKGMEW